MTRIMVDPTELEQSSGLLKGTAAQLRSIGGRCAQATGRLDWATRQRANVDGQVAQMQRLTEQLSQQSEALAKYLSRKAQEFLEADLAGAGDLDRVSATFRQVFAAGLGAATGGLGGINAARMLALQSLGTLTTPGAPQAGVTPVPSLGTLTMPGAPQAGVTPAPTPSEAPAPPVEDAFWAEHVGPAPVVTDADGRKQFAPQFQEWADRYNAQIASHWREIPSGDHMGTVGAENLIATYQMTPEKLETLWRVAGENHVDPRLLLGILRQEGTGSFNTAASTYSEHGHGPQPDFEKDLAAAMDGVIISKLRLYGKAREAGFEGSFVEYINYYTPRDNSPAGNPGVYAQDITWHKGVASMYTQVCRELGDTGDPVQAYSDWMAQNADKFQPKYITGEFTMKQGIPPGFEPPALATPKSLGLPPYKVVSEDSGFYYFKAPAEYCWYIVKQEDGK